MKKKIILLSICCLIGILSTILSGCTMVKESDKSFNIVTSFYPIYIMTDNIVQDAENVKLSNMTDTNVGCLHNYTLQPTDLKKVQNVNVFIENGLEIESFHDRLIKSVNNLYVIDSSKNIGDLIKDDEEINGHTWTSIANYIKQVEEIKDELKEKDPENSQIYEKNAQEYKNKLLSLKERYNQELSELKGKKVVSLNESFAYLLRDLQLDVTQIHTDHEESTISAEKLKTIIQKMKQDNIKIIIIDKNDDEKNAQTLKNETGAIIYKLDSGLTGNLDKNAYIETMLQNLEVLKQMI